MFFWGECDPLPLKKPLKKKKVKKKKVMIIASGLRGRTQKKRWKSVAGVGVGGGGYCLPPPPKESCQLK